MDDIILNLTEELQLAYDEFKEDKNDYLRGFMFGIITTIIKIVSVDEVHPITYDLICEIRDKAIE